MKHADVIKLHALGLITDDQRRLIIEHFHLREEESRMLQILAALGSVLVVAGIILLISANWDDIPRGVKIGTGLLLMLGAWAGGWFLREHRGTHPKTGEALYLVGGGLWLANIALLGQIYHLSSRTPNAFLLWFAGMAALPWILRTRWLFTLSLAAGVIWLGTEVNTRNGWFGGEWREAQFPLYGLVGLLLTGWSWQLRSGRWTEFSGPAGKLGGVLLLAGTYPLCWKWFGGHGMPAHPAAMALCLVLLAGGMALLALGLAPARTELNRQWRWTWGLTLSVLGALLAGALWAGQSQGNLWPRYGGESALYMPFALVLFVASLLQVQVGVMMRQPFLVNAGLAVLVLVMIAAYISLFGTMAVTGLMMLISGLFLLALGVYLERKRRQLLRQMLAVPSVQP